MSQLHPFYEAHRPAMEATMRLRLDLIDFAAYALRGIRLERTQTLAGGASHCDFRFSKQPEPHE